MNKKLYFRREDDNSFNANPLHSEISKKEKFDHSKIEDSTS